MLWKYYSHAKLLHFSRSWTFLSNSKHIKGKDAKLLSWCIQEWNYALQQFSELGGEEPTASAPSFLGYTMYPSSDLTR